MAGRRFTDSLAPQAHTVITTFSAEDDKSVANVIPVILVVQFVLKAPSRYAVDRSQLLAYSGEVFCLVCGPLTFRLHNQWPFDPANRG